MLFLHFLFLQRQESKAKLYKKMYNAMRTATPTVFVKSSNEGERRVMEGKYAYLAESTTVEYRTARNCDLMQVGQQLDSKGYGIGLPRGRDLDFYASCFFKNNNFTNIDNHIHSLIHLF